MLHPYGSADGWFAEPFDVREGQAAGIVSLEFASTREELGFIRGCKLQLSIGSSARGVRFQARELTGGSLFAHAAGLSVCAKDLPDPENRIVLSDTRSDNDGVPAPRMVYRVSSNSRQILDFGIERAVEVLEAAGAVEIRRTPLKSEAGFHPMGAARMGEDPETSVVDRFSRCHEAPNLYIADAGVFVTSSVLHSTATARALALRAADHIIAHARAEPNRWTLAFAGGGENPREAL